MGLEHARMHDHVVLVLARQVLLARDEELRVRAHLLALARESAGGRQALLAAKAGAYIISPFVGRLDDISTNGMELIHQILTIYRNYEFDTQVLVASIRHPIHVVESAMMGAHIGTMPFSVITQLVKHPLTDIGLERFLADWKKAQK